MQTDATTPINVGSCWPTMFRPFAWGFRQLSRLKPREKGRNIFSQQLPALMGLVTSFAHGLTTHENFFTEEFHCFATRVCHSNLDTAENVILLT